MILTYLSEISQVVDKLVNIGWSEYESKTYAALVILGTATASQISKRAEVPANRVYQILEKLINKGFVKRISAIGLTTKYQSLDIKELLNSDLETKKVSYSDAITALEQLTERQVDSSILRTFTIYGSKEVSINLSNMINKANEQILFFMDTLVELRRGDLIDILNFRGEDLDLSIKLMTSPRGINDKYEKEVYQELQDINLRITDDPLFTILLIIDEKELIFISYAQLTESTTPRDYFGVYLEDRKSVRMFLRMFNLSWESASFAPEKK